MAGKQAKTLTRSQVQAALRHARHGRYPERDRVVILLSVTAGLRAGEIAKLTWPMVLDADGRLAHNIELHDSAAKKASGRIIPLHLDLRRALQQLRALTSTEGAVIRSERGGARGMQPSRRPSLLIPSVTYSQGNRLRSFQITSWIARSTNPDIAFTAVSDTSRFTARYAYPTAARSRIPERD